MSQAVISNNQSIKINRAISGATTVNANCYAVVNYKYTSFTVVVGQGTPNGPYYIQRYFGPGQSISATIVFNSVPAGGGYQGEHNITLSLDNGVEFINSP